MIHVMALVVGIGLTIGYAALPSALIPLVGLGAIWAALMALVVAALAGVVK